jgi:hypothetical protein
MLYFIGDTDRHSTSLDKMAIYVYRNLSPTRSIIYAELIDSLIPTLDWELEYQLVPSDRW